MLRAAPRRAAAARPRCGGAARPAHAAHGSAVRAMTTACPCSASLLEPLCLRPHGSEGLQRCTAALQAGPCQGPPAVEFLYQDGSPVDPSLLTASVGPGSAPGKFSILATNTDNGFAPTIGYVRYQYPLKTVRLGRRSTIPTAVIPAGAIKYKVAEIAYSCPVSGGMWGTGRAGGDNAGCARSVAHFCLVSMQIVAYS